MVYFIAYYLFGLTTAILAMRKFQKKLDKKYSLTSKTPFTLSDLFLAMVIFWLLGPFLLAYESAADIVVFK